MAPGRVCVDDNEPLRSRGVERESALANPLRRCFGDDDGRIPHDGIVLGEASKQVLDAEAYKQQVLALAQGETSRFDQVLGQYENAPAVTRERMYLETMERILSDTNKTIIDTGRGGPGVVPYLPLTELPTQANRNSTPPRTGSSSTGGGQ